MKERQVTAVRKNGEGDIIEFRLEDGTVVDFRQAIQMARHGELAHANAFRGRDGQSHVRSDADGDPTNNFNNLPQF